MCEIVNNHPIVELYLIELKLWVCFLWHVRDLRLIEIDWRYEKRVWSASKPTLILQRDKMDETERINVVEKEEKIKVTKILPTIKQNETWSWALCSKKLTSLHNAFLEIYNSSMERRGRSLSEIIKPLVEELLLWKNCNKELC